MYKYIALDIEYQEHVGGANLILLHKNVIKNNKKKKITQKSLE